MDPKLKKIVTDVKETEGGLSNPPKVDKATRLQKELVSQGLQNEFSEDDIVEAALAMGVPADEIPSWLEDMASWLSPPER